MNEKTTQEKLIEDSAAIMKDGIKRMREIAVACDGEYVDPDILKMADAKIHKIRDETTKKFQDLVIGACIKQLVIEPLKLQLAKEFPGFAAGGMISQPEACKHGRSGRCPECNTEVIDKFNSRPGTITVTNKS